MCAKTGHALLGDVTEIMTIYIYRRSKLIVDEGKMPTFFRKIRLSFSPAYQRGFRKTWRCFPPANQGRDSGLSVTTQCLRLAGSDSG
jgi:hypothetical protein